MNSTSDPRPTATTEALPHHLRRGGTSTVLDLLPDRFPVVRHWGEDLGDLGDAALTDLRTAQTMSTETNRTWTASDLPVLPLPHLGWSARPALLLHRQDGSVFSAHVDSVSHEVTMDEGPGGAADVVVSRGVDAVHGIDVVTEIRLEPTGLVRVRARVADVAEEGASPLEVDEVTLLLPVPSDAVELLDMTGHHGFERRLVRTPFAPGPDYVSPGRAAPDTTPPLGSSRVHPASAGVAVASTACTWPGPAIPASWRPARLRDTGS